MEKKISILINLKDIDSFQKRLENKQESYWTIKPIWMKIKKKSLGENQLFQLKFIFLFELFCFLNFQNVFETEIYQFKFNKVSIIFSNNIADLFFQNNVKWK